MGKIKEIDRWRAEIQISESTREKEFGIYTNDKREKAGENIEYFENGFYDQVFNGSVEAITTLNIVDAIVSIIVPSLYFRNPKTVVLPSKIESEDSAPLVAKTIDYYRRKLEVEEVNKKVIWDAYVLGMGVYKTGYTTKFGMDIPDDEKKEKKTLIDKALEAVGLKKPEKKEFIYPELDYRIVAESPFIEYVSPFDFLIDPRATSINDARWLGQRIRKTVKEVKDNKKYKNTANLKGMTPNVQTFEQKDLADTQLEDFETVELYEIHYRNESKWYLLVLTLDGSGEFEEHYHDISAYELGEWQYDVLTFKKHGHKLYCKSDITKIKNLQDRVTNTIDSILEQVDKFVPKIAFAEDGLTTEGENALKNGGIAAIVKCSKNPNEVFKELSFTQLKGDLKALLDELITLISIQTGVTRAQITGLSDGGTATEATISQGGANIRLSDMTGAVQAMVNRQSRKLWKIIRQFVDLEELTFINGAKGIDENTGSPRYIWMQISPELAQQMAIGEYDFEIEVGSTERINLAVVRKAFENWFNILARTEVITLMQQQGKKVDVAEFLRKGLDAFPELGIDSSKIIQNITPETQGLVQPDMENRGGQTAGSTTNEMRSLQAESAPTIGSEINRGY